jgi:hypothetical protein
MYHDKNDGMNLFELGSPRGLKAQQNGLSCKIIGGVGALRILMSPTFSQACHCREMEKL